MWGWDLSQEEPPTEASSPKLLSSEAATSLPANNNSPQPVIVPNVEELKEQFQQQESILAHIRETLRENDADMSTKEKQLEMYANKLSQIKSRSKNQKKLNEAKQPCEEVKNDDHVDGANKLKAKGKMSELKKRLEENKKQFEERTEKGITDAKKIESMVEQLRTKVLESDATIHELQKSIDTPTPPRPKVQTLPRRQKDKPVTVAKWTQTLLFDSKVQELEAMVVDLQDTVKQQSSVIAARTKAVALLSEDLSKRGKSTVDELEDTRKEMREMQSKFISVETELKSCLVEKDNRLLDLEEKLQMLKNENAQLVEKSAILESELQKNNTTVSNSPDLEEKIQQLTKELDESNKLMIRLKLDHKNKIKTANKALEKLKKGSDDNSEILSLSTTVGQLVGEKDKLEAKITELEEEKASFVARSNEWESMVNAKTAEIENLNTQLSLIMEEKDKMLQNIDDQNILIDNLHARIQSMETSQLDVFEIPGDAASRQFDVSNQDVQAQIDGLVKEKQELLHKLKNIPLPLEDLDQMPISNRFDEDLANEKARNSELEAKIAELEDTLKNLQKGGPKSPNALKIKLRKLENDLKKEKLNIDELNKALKLKDQLIDDMNAKLMSDNIDNAWDCEALEETQKKCLTLESSLLQLTEQCEHLRKENIEVVHQLSGEKVRRIRAEEEAEDARVVLAAAQALETRIAHLEAAETHKHDLEYANIVIAGKDTEIFNLQSKLADKGQALDRVAEELKQTSDEINELRSFIQQRDYEIHLLRNNLMEAELREKQLAITVSQLKAELSEVNGSQSETVKKLLENAEFKSKEYEDMKMECHKLQAALDYAMMEITEERTKLEKQIQIGQDIMRQRDEAYIRIEESEKVLQKTWEERNELIQTQDRSYKQIVEMERQQEELLAKYRELTQIHAGCQTENLKKDLIAKQQDMENLTLKAKKLAANLKKKAQIEKELQDEINSLKHEGAVLTKQLMDSQFVIQEKDQQFKELLEKHENLNTAQNNLSLMENTHSEQTHSMMEKITELEATVLTLTARNQELQQQIKEMEDTMVDTRNNLTASNEKLEAISSENNFLNEKLILEKQEKEEMNELYKKMSNQLNALETAFQLEEQENETLMAQKAQMLTEIDNYVADIKKLQEENTRLALELENIKHLQEDYRILSDEKINIEKELENKMNEILAYEERINELHRSAENHSAVVTQFKNENDRINTEKRNLQDQLEQYSQWEEKCNMLFEEKTFIENEKNQLIASFEARLSDSQEIINKLEKDNKDFQNKLLTNDEQHATNIAQMEKQINNFNVAFDAEVQKNAALKSELEILKARIAELEAGKTTEKSERKKKKSVTFNTEDSDYIKELRGEVASLHRALVESDATVGELKAALGDKPETSAETFNVGLFDVPPAGDFFNQFPGQEANDQFVEDSLQWDDSWGTDGQLEADHAISKAPEENSEKMAKLESELKSLYSEKESVQEELRVMQVKYAKVIKKLKEQKSVIDRLQGEAKKSSGFGDLEAAMVDEMRAEMAKVEKREIELKKELESLKQENEGLLKKMEVLNSGNDKFLELKERQGSDAALWQNQQADLRAEIADLRAQLSAPVDELQLTQDNRELKNVIEGLEWKVSELTELIDEKEEEITRLQSQEAIECKHCSETSEKLLDVQQQLETLVTENEDLQDFIKNERKKAKPVEEPVSTLSQFFPSAQWQSPVSPFDNISQVDLSSNKEEIPVSLAENFQEEPHFERQIQGTLQGLPISLPDMQPTMSPIDFISEPKERTKDEIELALSRSLGEELSYQVEVQKAELNALKISLEHMERAYNEAKAEIDRLLREDQLRIENSTEDELAEVKQAFEQEKLRLESVIKCRDLELKSLQETLGSTEREWDETQGHNDGVIQQLKAQLRELDATAAHAIEDKDVEIRELRAQCEELQELCKSREFAMDQLRSELQSVSETNVSCSEKIRDEYESQLAAVNEALREKTEELNLALARLERQESENKALKNISDELNSLQKRLSAKESEFTSLLQQSSSVEAEFLLRDAEARELRAELFTKDSELRDLRSDMKTLRDEVSQFQNFDKQLLEIRNTQGQVQHVAATGWNMQETEDLCTRLQSDLDATLYHLHQRDVRCDELTLELTQLLEERDVLQLRLSNVIRQNEELRSNVNTSTSSTRLPSNEETIEAEGHLADKISELHTVGYRRDKNLQDESQQRHREQMALLGRENRGKATKQVFDI